MTNRTTWVFRIVLAFYFITGALYMITNYSELAAPWALTSLPSGTWTILGILQIIFAVILVLPSKIRIHFRQTSLAAYALAIISLLGSFLYIAYAGFPGILWALVPASLLLFIGHQKWI